MTNLTLDEDVAAALASEAERRGVPADRLANEELRARFCTDQSDSTDAVRGQDVRERIPAWNRS